MTNTAQSTTAPALNAAHLEETMDLRVVPGERNSVWSFGKLRRLFFVTGHARSGTTWAAAVLARHPRAFVDGEFHFQQLRQGFDSFQRHPWHRATRDPVHTAAECCFQDTIRLCIGACAHQKLEADWIGDRTPRYLEVLLPGSPHFVIVRDGRDVVVSLSIMEINQGGGLFNQFAKEEKLWRARERFLAEPDFFKKNPGELLRCEPFVRCLARRWGEQAAHDVRMADRIRAGEIDATVLIVRYEALHLDPEGEREKMYRFLGVDPAEAEPLTAESGTKPGLQTENHRSDKRKGAVGDWMNYFTDDAKRWFKEEAGEALVSLEYESGHDW